MRIWLTIFLLLCAVACSAADVTVTWDHNDPRPEGYRIFTREADVPYNYDVPIWQGPENIATVTVDDNTVWYFVVRAYEGDLESADSEEVSYDAHVIIPPMLTTGATNLNVTWEEINATKIIYPVGTLPDGSVLYFVE